MFDNVALLPSNATAWEKINSTVSARLLNAPVSLILKERDPINCAAQFVAPLAWERSVHFWDPNDTTGNRWRTKNSFRDHLNYGCPAALEEEIGLDTGLRVAIREFWEVPGLVWPDFTVDAPYAPGATPADLAPVRRSALARKPVRDVLAKVRLAAPILPAPFAVGAACSATVYATILPLGGVPPSPAFVVGAAVARIVSLVHILPLGAQ